MRGFDAFCGGGGATRGYQLAGFHMTGCDIKPQPRYCGETFVQTDALTLLADPEFMAQFAFVHAAPLWHRWTTQARGNGTADNHPDDVGAAHSLLQESRRPFVLELGTLSPLPGVTICGVSCGLEVIRHMRFLTNWPLFVPPCSHKHGGTVEGLYVAYRPGSKSRDAKGWGRPPRATRREWREAAGLGWMDWREADLASPPAYTELIGSQLMAHLKALPSLSAGSSR